MDSGLAVALQQEEKGPSVDLLPQVGASTRSIFVRYYNALPAKRRTLQMDIFTF